MIRCWQKNVETARLPVGCAVEATVGARSESLQGHEVNQFYIFPFLFQIFSAFLSTILRSLNANFGLDTSNMG